MTESSIVIRPSNRLPTKTIVVVGAFRGGTSYVGELLCKGLEIPMGEKFAPVTPAADYTSYEDQEFSTEINSLFDENGCVLPYKTTYDAWQRIKTLIDQRNEAYPVWGFKKPSSVFVIDRLLTFLRNPHLIIVLRDPLAAWISSTNHGASLDWYACRHHVGCVMDLIEKPRAPTLAISFEKARPIPKRTIAAIKDFLYPE